MRSVVVVVLTVTPTSLCDSMRSRLEAHSNALPPLLISNHIDDRYTHLSGHVLQLCSICR